MPSNNNISHTPKVWILLASYNGAAYLADFLGSLLLSDYESWEVLAYDDGSSDDSVDILNRFQSEHPDKLSWYYHTSPFSPKGAKRAFADLAHHALSISSHYDLFMFADQDDVWHPEKISRMVTCYLQQQRTSPGPMLLHSDLEVADASNQLISTSLLEMQHTDPAKNQIQDLLVQNCVTGCATLLNQELLALSTPCPEGMVMHDWWLALIAAGVGTIIFIPEPLVTYRQHGHNAVGAKNYGLLYALKHLIAITRGLSDRLPLTALITQAQSLRQHTAYQHFPIQQQLRVKHFSELPTMGLFQRLSWFKETTVRRNGKLRNLAMLFDILLLAH